MSDVNKIVAAILTAGRMPMQTGEGFMNMDDWWAEYQAWLETLEKHDLERTGG